MCFICLSNFWIFSAKRKTIAGPEDEDYLAERRVDDHIHLNAFAFIPASQYG